MEKFVKNVVGQVNCPVAERPQEFKPLNETPCQELNDHQPNEFPFAKRTFYYCLWFS